MKYGLLLSTLIFSSMSFALSPADVAHRPFDMTVVCQSEDQKAMLELVFENDALTKSRLVYETKEIFRDEMTSSTQHCSFDKSIHPPTGRTYALRVSCKERSGEGLDFRYIVGFNYHRSARLEETIYSGYEVYRGINWPWTGSSNTVSKSKMTCTLQHKE